MTPVPEQLMEALRGDRARRPRRDDTTAAGLRALLEDHAYDILGAQRLDAPLIVSGARLRPSVTTRDLADATLSRSRGVIVALVTRLLVAGVHVGDPYDDALCAWRADRPGDPLLETVDHLDAELAARLRADVTAHVTTLRAVLGEIPSAWRPRSAQRARQVLGGGNLELRDVVDLIVGSLHGESANVALVDVTTSPLGVHSERLMRFHALVQTLRTSVVPLRTSILSTATAEVWTHDVTPELLLRGVDDVVTAMRGEVAA